MTASVLDALDATEVLDLDLRERKESPLLITPFPDENTPAYYYGVK